MEALALTDTHPVKYFLISAPVDWSPDQYIRRFLLPTGEYVSCVLWYVLDRRLTWLRHDCSLII
jgi:hypothetical protein